MKTVIVNIPENKENLLLSFLKKHRMNTHIVDREEDEGKIAKWIDEGMESGDVSEHEIYKTLRKNGAKFL